MLTFLIDIGKNFLRESWLWGIPAVISSILFERKEIMSYFCSNKRLIKFNRRGIWLRNGLVVMLIWFFWFFIYCITETCVQHIESVSKNFSDRTDRMVASQREFEMIHHWRISDKSRESVDHHR